MKALIFISIAFLWPMSVMAFGPDEIFPDVKTESALTTEELEVAFSGVTHYGSYNFLPKNITTHQFEETTHKDGRLKHIQQGIIDTGSWEISEGVICYDYDLSLIHI